MPSAIIGGVSFMLYGMISAIGVRNVVDVYKRQTLERLPGITWRKAGMTSNHHAPYDWGYTRATMA